METCVGLGLSVGPAVGGLLYSVRGQFNFICFLLPIITIFRKIGGFGLPFYVIGVCLILLTPLNMLVIPRIESNIIISLFVFINVFYSFFVAQPSTKADGSFRRLIKVPHILIVCAIIVVVSLTWSFLDPTLEPHLRKV